MWMWVYSRGLPFTYPTGGFNKTKNTNGMILEAYTEELNLFQICEMLVPDYSD